MGKTRPRWERHWPTGCKQAAVNVHQVDFLLDLRLNRNISHFSYSSLDLFCFVFFVFVVDFFLLAFPRPRVSFSSSWRIQLPAHFHAGGTQSNTSSPSGRSTSASLRPHQRYRSTWSQFPGFWGLLTQFQQAFCSQAVLMYKPSQPSCDLGHASCGRKGSALPKQLLMALSCLSSLILSRQPVCLNS